MTQQGVVREKQTPNIYTDAPSWMLHIMNNYTAYGDFYLDLTAGIQRCESQMADFVTAGKEKESLIMVGKREALLELRYLLEAYKRQEDEENAG